jgi:hypothetical protein
MLSLFIEDAEYAEPTCANQRSSLTDKVLGLFWFACKYEVIRVH